MTQNHLLVLEGLTERLEKLHKYLAAEMESPPVGNPNRDYSLGYIAGRKDAARMLNSIILQLKGE